MERPESPKSPVQNLIKPQDIQNKLPLSPKMPKIPKAPNTLQSRFSDSTGKYVRDSPNNFRRTAEHRRESPRYAEPVRRNSRDPRRGPGETTDERLAEIEQKAQKLLNSPYRSQDGQEFYNSAPQGFKFIDKEGLNEEEGLGKIETVKTKPPKGKK